jgi:hypothetical protein
VMHISHMWRYLSHSCIGRSESRSWLWRICVTILKIIWHFYVMIIRQNKLSCVSF